MIANVDFAHVVELSGSSKRISHLYFKKPRKMWLSCTIDAKKNPLTHLAERLDALKAKVQVMAIPDSDKVETSQYQEMLKVLEKLRKAMYGE